MSGGGFVELCPQCKKYLAVGDFWNGGSQLFCVACGYFYTERIDFCEEALQESGFLPYFDGTRDGGCKPRKITTEERRGFGAALFTDRQECKARICYPVPITQELIDEFMKDISSPDIDLTRCYLTRWNDETQDVEFIFGREELVADLLVENNRWDDEIGDWIGQEVALRDETVVYVRWDDKTGEVELVFGQEEPWSGEFAASVPPNDEYRDIEFDSEQEHLGDESVVDYR